MRLSPDGHIWLKNINEKAREMRVLLNTYDSHELRRARDHLTHVELWARHFMEEFENKQPGGFHGKVNSCKAEQVTQE